jgi:MFS family permease
LKFGGKQMAEYSETAINYSFKDRKVRLVILGILQIIFGGFCALMVPLMILGMLATSAVAGKGAAEGVSLKMMIPGILLYLALAVWFVWIGIGSIMARRWARALILVSSWLWLICGVCGFVLMLMIIPNMYDKMGESGQMPKAAITVAKYVVEAFLAVFYVVVPGVFVLLYSGKDVKATCEHRDPQERWTDKCPLPVLAVSLVSVVWAVSILSMGIYGWAIPFFGSIVSGTNGAMMILALALVLAYIAWGTYKLDVKAWWCALLVYIGWAFSGIITFSTVSMNELYEKIGFSGQHLDMIRQYSTLWEQGMCLFLGFWVIIVLAYLIYVRRYFVGASLDKSEQGAGNPV